VFPTCWSVYRRKPIFQELKCDRGQPAICIVRVIAAAAFFPSGSLLLPSIGYYKYVRPRRIGRGRNPAKPLISSIPLRRAGGPPASHRCCRMRPTPRSTIRCLSACRRTGRFPWTCHRLPHCWRCLGLRQEALCAAMYMTAASPNVPAPARRAPPVIASFRMARYNALAFAPRSKKRHRGAALCWTRFHLAATRRRVCSETARTWHAANAPRDRGRCRRHTVPVPFSTCAAASPLARVMVTVLQSVPTGSPNQKPGMWPSAIQAGKAGFS
jgi:hypothetical protein